MTIEFTAVTIPLDERAAAATEIAAQHAADVDAAARFPHEAVGALRDAGLLGASVPVEFGGESATVAGPAPK